MIYAEFNNIVIENYLGVYPVKDSTKTIAKHLSKLKFKSALDMGCGTGFITIYLKSLNLDCEGVDINPAAIESAKKNNIEANFYLSDLFEKVKAEKKFDLIIFNAPLTDFKFGCVNKYLNIIKSLLPKKKPFISWI